MIDGNLYLERSIASAGDGHFGMLLSVNARNSNCDKFRGPSLRLPMMRSLYVPTISHLEEFSPVVQKNLPNLGWILDEHIMQLWPVITSRG
jgi:hypothetical protein